VTESLQVQLKKGVLELCVLALLSRQESYAYELASVLARDVGMGEGTIYPLMRRLSGGVGQRAVAQVLQIDARRPQRVRDAESRVAGFCHLDQSRTGGATMTRAEFIAQLRQALSGMAPAALDDVVADYNAHFDEGLAAGRSEAEVAAALGDPLRLARELRAEAGLRRWESQRTPAALVSAMVSLGGMLAVDIFILLPFLLVFALGAFVTGMVLFAISVAGFALLLSGLLHWDNVATIVSASSRTLAGVGLLGGGVGGAALLWLLFEGLVRLLGRYARLHYQVLKPADRGG